MNTKKLNEEDWKKIEEVLQKKIDEASDEELAEAKGFLDGLQQARQQARQQAFKDVLKVIDELKPKIISKEVEGISSAGLVAQKNILEELKKKIQNEHKST